MSTSCTATDRPAAGDAVVLRPAHARDADALRRLATLDSAVPLRGEVIVAEREGEIVAAHELGGRSIADPFLPAAELVTLLEKRGALLGRPAPHDREPLARRLLSGPLFG